MDDRTNTIAGWALFSGIVALGLGSLSTHYFLADRPERPETMGYEIEGVVSSEAGGAVAEEGIEARLAKADPAKGEGVFKKCQSCHSIDQGGANGIGPNLFGTVSKPIASHAGYAFSDALKAKDGNWDWANLDAWLKSPKGFAAGTKMTFAGIADGQDRANLIVFLNTKGTNLPLPAAPAAPAGDNAPVGDAAPMGETGPAAAGATAAAVPAAAAKQ